MKRIEWPIYVRNIDSLFNKKGLIEYTVEVNIYYQEHREDRNRCDWRIKVECDFGNTVASMPQF